MPRRSDPSPPRTALDEARRAFEKMRIKLPPIPERFAGRLRTNEKWCFASRKIDPMQMYCFNTYLYEALVGKGRDYVAVSHAGQGINSYAINYHLVDGPILLMVQESFGGGYSDEDADRRDVEAQFERCAALLAALDAKARVLKRQPGRLCVFESTFRQSFAWGWMDEPRSDEQAARDWLREHQVPDDESGGRIAEKALPTNAAREWLATI